VKPPENELPPKCESDTKAKTVEGLRGWVKTYSALGPTNHGTLKVLGDRVFTL